MQKATKRNLVGIMEAVKNSWGASEETLEEIAEIIAEASLPVAIENRKYKPKTERVTRDSTQRSRRFELPDWYTSGFE